MGRGGEGQRVRSTKGKLPSTGTLIRINYNLYNWICMRVLCYVLQRDNLLARDTGEICYEIFFHPLFTIDPNTTFILYTYTHMYVCMYI